MGGEVRLICETDLTASRRAQGWSVTVPEGVEIKIADRPENRRELLEELVGKGNVHVASGLGAYPLPAQATWEALAKGDQVYILSERPRMNGLKAPLKALAYSARGQKLAPRVQGVFAYGALGASFFRRIGFAPEKVFEFAYSVEAASFEFDEISASSDELQLLFVGSELRRKGLDLLIEALSSVSELKPWRLTVVTADDDLTSYQKIASRAHLEKRIVWQQPGPNAEIRRQMRRSDILILPSRFDGWGAVVNEALHAGTRVIVSDKCGSECLLQSTLAGWRFGHRTNVSLERALEQALCAGRQPEANRAVLSTWAASAVGPEAMARYFIGILNAEGRAKTKPPWTLHAGI